MNKTFALLVRALRTESRDIKSHLFRFGLAGLVVLILFLGRSAMEVHSAPGRIMFKWMTVANWVVITLAGGTVFAIAISEETEQQTLGLLRMANVGPLSLLLGKWLPRMLTAIVLISIQFPFTWLTVTLGGVSWQQIWASYLMLLAHLVLVGNVGLLASVLKPNSATACAWAFIFMITARLLPVFVWGGLQYGILKGWVPAKWGTNVWENIVVPLNHWSASGRLFWDILTTSFQGEAWTSQVISNLVIGAGLFLVSWILFDRATMRHMSGGPQKASLLTRLITRKSRSSAATWDWALGWKDFQQVGGGLRMILLKTILYAILWGSIIYINRLYGSDFPTALHTSCGVMAWITMFLLPLELSFLAAKLFRPELNNQTWSTLLTLPKSLPEIAYSKLAGSMLGLIPTATAWGVSLSPFFFEWFREITRNPTSILVIVYLLSILLISLHLVTYFSITVNWAAWPIAVILGMGCGGFGNFLVWIFLTMAIFFGLGGGGGGDNVFYAGLIMLTCANVGLAVVIHLGIGQSLQAKGAQS